MTDETNDFRSNFGLKSTASEHGFQELEGYFRKMAHAGKGKAAEDIITAQGMDE